MLVAERSPKALRCNTGPVLLSKGGLSSVVGRVPVRRAAQHGKSCRKLEAGVAQKAQGLYSRTL